MSNVFRRGCLQLNTALKVQRCYAVPTRNGLDRFQTTVLRPRCFGTTPQRSTKIANETPPETHQKDEDEYEKDVKAGIEAATKQQIKRPWQREGADKPPVDQEARNANKTMAKGEILICPRAQACL